METFFIIFVSTVKNVYNFAPMEKKKDIIEQALKTYMKYGIKSVTMDEMARQLGISKKTLYQYVKDKNDLVQQCLLRGHEQDCEEIEQIFSKKQDAITEIIEVSRYIVNQLRAVHPSIFFDLSKYHPGALKLMHDHKYDVVCGSVMDNLYRGIEQKLYRSDMNVELVARMYMAFMDHVLAGDFFDAGNYRPDGIYSEFFHYHIRGIASKKGLKQFIELIENDENI